MAEIKVIINGTSYMVEEGKTILQAAKENGIHIPTLCHFEGIEGRANCRMCVVEVKGMRTFQPACVTKVSNGMDINTDSEAIRESRKATLELILAHHAIDCHHCLRIGSSSEQSLDPKFCEMCFWCDCVRDGFCELQALAREYHVDVLPYVMREKDYEEDKSLGSIIRNPNKCIKCRRCVDVCGEVQTVQNLSMANRGQDIMVVPELGKPMAESACVRCGHCVDVCPVGAIYIKEDHDEILYMAHSYSTDVVAQLSDDVLPELNRLYKLEDGTITDKHVCAALRKVGVSKVVSDKAAKTESAKQAASIIEAAEGPVMITESKAVLNFTEQFFPEMKSEVKAYESAQTVFGKSAGKLVGDKPIRTLNVTAVKAAAAEAVELGDVNYVLNERELYRTFLRTGGAPAKKNPCEFDAPCETEMPYAELLGDCKWSIGCEPVKVSITVNGKDLKCAIATNLGQVRKMLEGEYKNYDVVRLMA